jgi:hypothetical protein
MWDPQYLTTLQASKACYSFNGSLYKSLFLTLKAEHKHRILVACKSDDGEKRHDKELHNYYFFNTFYIDDLFKKGDMDGTT